MVDMEIKTKILLKKEQGQESLDQGKSKELAHFLLLILLDLEAMLGERRKIPFNNLILLQHLDFKNMALEEVLGA